ncbi:unnamed protein product, partial [Callosobruchus maculatus]
MDRYIIRQKSSPGSLAQHEKKPKIDFEDNQRAIPGTSGTSTTIIEAEASDCGSENQDTTVETGKPKKRKR